MAEDKKNEAQPAKAIEPRADAGAKATKDTLNVSEKVVNKAAEVNDEAVAMAATKTKNNMKKSAAKARKASAAVRKEEETMTNMDMKNWFGGYDVPNAEKIEELMQNAGKQGEEMLARSRAAGEDMVEMTRANIEALIEAGRIAASGAKEIGTDLIEDGRSQFESNSENLRKLAEAKNPTELVQLQSEMIRSQFDAMVSEGAKLTERMVKLAGDAMQPVSNRASLNVEKAKDLMA